VGNADTDMILVGAKSDLEGDRKVSRKQAETLADKYNLRFVEVSAKEDANIGSVFELLTQQVIERLKIDEKSMENNTTSLSGKK
jgi:GTPase SAR1 family protein